MVFGAASSISLSMPPNKLNPISASWLSISSWTPFLCVLKFVSSYHFLRRNAFWNHTCQTTNLSFFPQTLILNKLIKFFHQRTPLREKWKEFKWFFHPNWNPTWSDDWKSRTVTYHSSRFCSTFARCRFEQLVIIVVPSLLHFFSIGSISFVSLLLHPQENITHFPFFIQF